ncbi:elongation factor P [Patescibacteria group bacterium]|nr:elongation factor P [Patescibacteria group bacterium]
MRIKGETYVIINYQFVNPGKGAAFTRTKVKNVKSGKVMEITFRSDEQVEEANMEYKRCQYLYSDGSDFHFMDNSSYEQFSMSAEMVGEQADYMMDGGNVVIVFVDGMPVSLQLPPKMEFKVIESPPGEKGDTATGGTKQVTIETGAKVAAPLFIKEGDIIRVNTETGAYTERVVK